MSSRKFKRERAAQRTPVLTRYTAPLLTQARHAATDQLYAIKKFSVGLSFDYATSFEQCTVLNELNALIPDHVVHLHECFIDTANNARFICRTLPRYRRTARHRRQTRK